MMKPIAITSLIWPQSDSFDLHSNECFTPLTDEYARVTEYFA